MQILGGLVLVLLPAVLATLPCRKESQDNDDGDKFLTCTECLRGAKEAGCGWCLDNDRNKLAKGCMLETDCNSGAGNFNTRPLSEENKNDPAETADSKIWPADGEKGQKVVLKSRPSVKNRIEFIAQRRKNPVDIYFMIDLTKSMKEVKEHLATIVTGIKDEIIKTTTDYRFGFGGFNEKPIPPFDSFHTDGRKFDFVHIQSMTSDTEEIVDKINKTELFDGNKDSPEGGLDGLMQLLLCQDNQNPFGWRQGVKGIVVFVTNAPSHLAGDGLLGGVWKPYKHDCQMTEVRNDQDFGEFELTRGNQVYDSLDTDYPSVSSLRYELRKSTKSVVFGTGHKVLDFYKRLSKALDGNPTIASADDMRTDGGELKKVILKVYKEISESVRVEAVPNPSEIKVTIEKDGVFKDKVDNTVRHWVDVVIDPEVCTRSGSDEDKKITFHLRIQNQKNDDGKDDQMKVEVTPLCDCDCNKPASDHSVCSKTDPGATLNCGACNCVEKQGETCACDKDTSLGDTTECQDSSGVICSNNGKCECSKCKCKSGHVGNLCECHDQSNLCGDRGVPECTDNRKVICKCKDGWTNDGASNQDCSCSTNEEHPECRDPKTKKICSDKGNCKCAKCECDSGFGGKFCQKEDGLSQSDIDKQTCDSLTPCILEYMYKNASEHQEKWNKWNNACEQLKALPVYNILPVSMSKTDKEQNDTENSEKDACSSGFGRRCEIDLQKEKVAGSEGQEDCKLNFCHDVRLGGMDDYENVNQMEIKLSVSGEEKCGVELPLSLILGSSIGAGALLFIIGFLTFCIVINLRDRREYKKYLVEVEKINRKDFKDNRAYRQSRASLRKSMMPKGVTFGRD